MKLKIIKYYDNLASEYDKDRFANSYGNYINTQETLILKKYLNKETSLNLDLACGTGRFLEYADFGIDISKNMIDICKEKFSNKDLRIGDVETLPYESSFFNNIFSFHLFMHLEYSQLETIFKKISKVIKKDGLFIFDIPSKKRRTLTNYKTNSWHGANQISSSELKSITSEHWELISYHGIAFFPIHLIPKRIRKYFIPLDNFLCNSIFKEWSSHIIYVLKKR